MPYLPLMGLEDELASRAADGRDRTDRRSLELAQFQDRWSEFNTIMQKHGVSPEALYTIEFVRQIQKGRSKGVFRDAQVGIDEYRVTPVLDVWFVSTDDQDWAGPGTGKAITTDGQLVHWTTDHNPVRRSFGGLSGGGRTVHETYVGLRPRTGPSYLSVPAVPVGTPTPLMSPPSGGTSEDGLAELAEFYLGKTAQHPIIFI